jgi:hypothetical protein
MPPRIHPLFPTREEVSKNPDLAYSDHLPILTKVPLGEESISLNIISLNILGGSNFSGIHALGQIEKPEEMLNRYQRIADGLIIGAQKHDVDVILLQEAYDEILPYLKSSLGDDWEIISQSGIISCYNKRRLIQQSATYDNTARVHSLTLTDEENGGQTIDVHNIWGNYTPLSHHLEEDCRIKLLTGKSKVSIIIGDTNSRIASLDHQKRNQTTGAIPGKINELLGYAAELQIPDHPDGGFYRDEEGVIHQLPIQILDFATGEIIEDERSQEEIEAWSESRMVMCLDDSYKHKIVINEQSIFDYENAMRAQLGEQLIVRVATDIFNNKSVAISFPNKSEAYKLVKKRLSAVEGFQFRSVNDDYDGKQYLCVFAPIEKADLLHQAIHQVIHPEAWSSSLRGQVIYIIDIQINKLSESHWYFRDASEKIKALMVLKDRIEMASPACSKADLLAIVKAWENESELPSAEITNLQLMGQHQNVFFSANRPDVKTATVSMLDTLEKTLAEPEGIVPGM